MVQTAHAQYVQTDHSIEVLIADSKTVVRGTISESDRNVILPRGNRDIPDGKVEYTFKVAIDEVLKGDVEKELTLVRVTSAYDMRIPEWKEAGTELLWFVDQSGLITSVSDLDFDHKWSAIRLGEPVEAEEMYHTHAPPILSIQLRWLSEPDEILAAARNAVRLFEESPNKLVEMKQIGMAPRLYVVPILDGIDEAARKLIEVDEEIDLFLGPRYSHRETGVDLLRNFKTMEHIALLQQLLEDEEKQRFGIEGGRVVWRYPVRAMAYDVLTEWDIVVDKPVVEIPIR